MTGVWHGAPDRILIEQTYPGKEDHEAHFATLLPAFQDRRYLRADNKPMFVIFEPANIPDAKQVFKFWRQMARDAGLPGLHLVGCAYSDMMDPAQIGLDPTVATLLPPLRKTMPNGQPSIYRYEDIYPTFVLDRRPGINTYPCVVPISTIRRAAAPTDLCYMSQHRNCLASTSAMHSRQSGSIAIKNTLCS